MKAKLTFLFLLISILTKLNSQSCEVPNILIKEYEQDVKHLTLNRLITNNSPLSEFAEIPELNADTIWEGLAAIFNSNLPQANQVFDEYCIHHSDIQSLTIYNELYVRVDTGTVWHSNWSNGIFETGNQDVDLFFQQYGFQLNGSLASVFKIKTRQILNINPIVDTILVFNEVNLCERKTYIGSGDRIIYQTNGEERLFDFYKRWGDCQSGCIYWYKWSFSVNQDCDVQFLDNDWNSTNLPSPLDCQISMSTSILNNHLSNIEIFPIPTKNEIVIKGIEQLELILNYEIYNSIGELLKYGSLNSSRIDISKFVNGIYLLILEGKNGNRITKKIIKK